jgi:hypothetical protein
VLVVGKDLHRHPFAVAAIEALRAVRDDVVTVDMGWPSDDRACADIATFGASRLVGEALIALVATVGGTRPGEGAMRLGIDIGGTKTAAVAIGEDGELSDQVRMPTGFGAEEVVATALRTVERMTELAGVPASSFASIGIGIPGAVDSDRGRVAHAVNLGLEGLDLGPRLARPARRRRARRERREGGRRRRAPPARHRGRHPRAHRWPT